MLIEEIIRSCANEHVAEAAVASIGPSFFGKVRCVASSYGMGVGAYVVLAVDRFARHGDEGEMRSIFASMHKAQEPVLAGLHGILCVMMAAGTSRTGRPRPSVPRIPATICALEIETRRSVYS